MNTPRRNAAFILIGLQCAFMLRVAGQLAVAAGIAPWLPPFEQWQSGLLPYPVLVLAQLGIIGVQTKIASDVVRNSGFFSQRNVRLASLLTKCGGIYFAVMIGRYVIRMAVMPDQRWFGGCVPIAFHFVLASYVMMVASQLRRGRVSPLLGTPPLAPTG